MQERKVLRWIITMLLYTMHSFVHGYKVPITYLSQRHISFHSRRLSLHSSTSPIRDISPTVDSKLNKILQSNSKYPCQFLFVGGKGGVGKTSSSSAIAIACSDAGLKTLIVSTDPAHSLGDALDVDLSNGELVNIVTEQNLSALEIDVEKVLSEFKAMAKDLNTDSLAASLGVPKNIIDSIGLNDLTSIFTNPPPGIDEILALTNIIKYADLKSANGTPRFERIIIDTAPTGHTLRLLQLPLFLSSVTSKLISFRSTLTSAVNSFKSFFGSDESSSQSSPLSVLDKLESFQENLASLKRTLEDPNQTQFAVVTIPTNLAVAESERLVSSLRNQNIEVASVICNQILSPEFGTQYVQRRRAAQRKCADEILRVVSASNIESTEVSYVDTEVTGIYGLRFFASIAHPPIPKRASNPIDSRKLTIFGGKGGVGKTTSAGSWGVQLSDSGFRTLVVSTDPAHSLGDAFTEKLDGIPRLLDVSHEGGELWAMEIDPATAIDEFKSIVKSTVEAKPESSGGGMTGSLLGGLGIDKIREDLLDLVSGVNDPPPGTDEIVALTKIISYLDRGFKTPNGKVVKFDRVVLDTAPTGHTLRMLDLPQFLQQLVSKVKSIRDKLGSMGIMNSESAGESEAQGRLEKFELDMKRLEQILHNPKEAEFVVVTIPTDLAVAESKRLLTSLKVDEVNVRRLIINQMIPYQQSEGDQILNSYLNRVRYGQEQSIEKLSQLAKKENVQLVKVPYFDTEVRSVYGLRVLGNSIIQK